MCFLSFLSRCAAPKRDETGAWLRRSGCGEVGDAPTAVVKERTVLGGLGRLPGSAQPVILQNKWGRSGVKAYASRGQGSKRTATPLTAGWQVTARCHLPAVFLAAR